MTRYDLLQRPLLRRILTNRWPQFLVRIIALVGFLLVIEAGLAGSPVGNRNLSIVFIWILWWALLILIAVPFLGRSWCSICPIPLPGEWLQQGTLLGPSSRSRSRGLGRRWPRRLRHIWIQNTLFILIALFSAPILTLPKLTAGVLFGLLVCGLLTSLVFERRAFCRYLCPVSGFIGLYAQVAPLELRVKDTSVCAAHKTKTCYLGNEQGYGCPWGVFPGGLVRNSFCGNCMECLRTCPHDNLALNLRPFGDDLAQPRGRTLDEAFKAFIMLGSAFTYSAVMLGPWGALKAAAFSVGSWPWWGYALTFLCFTLVLLPGGFLLATQVSRALSASRRQPRQLFISFAYVLLPLGLAAWIAFTLSFVFSNISYAWPLLSDPFGRGWDLLGTAALPWKPYLSQWVPQLQLLVLLGGLSWASLSARRIAAEDGASAPVWRAALPIVLFCLFFTVGILWLLVG